MLPADGRNHKKTHRIEFNKRTGRLICGCGWKSEPIGKKLRKRNPEAGKSLVETTDEIPCSSTGRDANSATLKLNPGGDPY
jgi:hypothetical protein